MLLEGGSLMVPRENDRVRVLQAILKKGERAVVPSHHHHVLYFLKGNRVQLTSPSGKVDTMDIETDEPIFMEPQSLEVKNIGENELELVVIELKKMLAGQRALH